MKFGPIARIILRYIVGAAFMGSSQIGDQLAADPDIVVLVSVLVGGAVEIAYALAVKYGWSK